MKCEKRIEGLSKSMISITECSLDRNIMKSVIFILLIKWE